MSLEIYLILGAISFFTSMVTAIFSVGGGMIMLASLGQFVGASALIPLHASVQLLNNISRVYVYKEHINFGILKTILWASFIGSLIAIFIFQNLEKIDLEDTWSTSILTRKLKKSKKIEFFFRKLYFFLLNLNST